MSRIGRHGSYAVLRAVTNVLLRDLNARLIVEQELARDLVGGPRRHGGRRH